MSDILPSAKKISTAWAAKFLGISRWTLRRWGDKKLLPFTASRSGYRYYKQEDLDTFKEKHSIVHTRVKKLSPRGKAPASAQKPFVKDETLLLPPAPEPKELIVPPPPSADPSADGPPQKKSVFHHLWKILPFTGILVLCLFIIFPTAYRPRMAQRTENILGFTVETPSSILPLLSFRDVVMAAATDSSELTGSSVQFFLSDTSESVNAMLSPNGDIPESGNVIYLSSMTNFASFQDSPFAYLNGSHGPAGPVAIIDNADALRSHPFFANVHNGDKLLIYKEGGKAILFRPLTNEVIAFAPLDAVPSTSYQQVDGQPVVALRNGMGTPYDMKTFEAELTYIEPRSVVVDNANAVRGDYPRSLIVDVVGNKKADAQSLAYKLRLTLSDLPAGEFRPPAGVDFLVILGKDRVPLMNYIAPTSTASAAPR